MPTPTHELRANRSADARLLEYNRRLRDAEMKDRAHETPHDKRQWMVLLGWLLAESKKASPEDRRQMFEHLLECANRMNTATRRV